MKESLNICSVSLESIGQQLDRNTDIIIRRYISYNYIYTTFESVNILFVIFLLEDNISTKKCSKRKGVKFQKRGDGQKKGEKKTFIFSTKPDQDEEDQMWKNQEID